MPLLGERGRIDGIAVDTAVGAGVVTTNVSAFRAKTAFSIAFHARGNRMARLIGQAFCINTARWDQTRC